MAQHDHPIDCPDNTGVAFDYLIWCPRCPDQPFEDHCCHKCCPKCGLTEDEVITGSWKSE